MSPREPSRASKTQKVTFSKTSKNLSFFVGFWDPEASQESLKRPKKAPRGSQRLPEAPTYTGPKSDIFKNLKKLSFFYVFGIQRPPKRASRDPRRLTEGPERAPKPYKKVIQKST